MDYESLVMYYLTAQGLFLSPQFSVKDAVKNGVAPISSHSTFETMKLGR